MSVDSMKTWMKEIQSDENDLLSVHKEVLRLCEEIEAARTLRNDLEKRTREYAEKEQELQKCKEEHKDCDSQFDEAKKELKQVNEEIWQYEARKKTLDEEHRRLEDEYGNNAKKDEMNGNEKDKLKPTLEDLEKELSNINRAKQNGEHLSVEWDGIQTLARLLAEESVITKDTLEACGDIVKELLELNNELKSTEKMRLLDKPKAICRINDEYLTREMR